MGGSDRLLNYIAGEWRPSSAAEYLDVVNPATVEVLGRVPLSPAAEVDQAARAASAAFPGWRRIPASERAQYLFKLKGLLEEHFEDLSRTITEECGKTLDHPAVRAISFVGSTAVARYVYARAAANGKRIQCGGGAKNPIVVLPDADLPMTTRITADSAFGCAGQRCLAASLAVTVGEAKKPFAEAIAEAAATRVVGYGLAGGVQMGPVISHESKRRVEQLIGQGAGEGAEVLVDGRGARIPGYEAGSFVRPTVLRGLPPGSEVARTEIFGPVLGLMHVDTIDEAIELVNGARYGNMACVFTQNGAAARRFRYEAEVGNVGINVGIAAPIAFFPSTGSKESVLGDLAGPRSAA